MKRSAGILVFILFSIIFISNCSNANSITNSATENGSSTPVQKYTTTPSPTSMKSTTENLPNFALYGKSQLPVVLPSSDGNTLYVLDDEDLQVLDAHDLSVISRKNSVCGIPKCSMQFMGDNDAFLVIQSEESFWIYDANTLDQIQQKIPVVPINNGTDEMTLQTKSSMPVISPDNKYSFARFGQYYVGYYRICRSELNHENNGYEFCYPTNLAPHADLTLGEPVISPDGKTLVATVANVYEGKSLYFWDVETGRILHEEKKVPATLSNLQFSPDGSMLLGTKSSLLYIMNPTNGKNVKIINGLQNWIDQFRFSNDPDKLIIIDRHQQPIMYQFSTDQFIPYEIELDNLPYFTDYEKNLMEEGYWASNRTTASLTMANYISRVDNVSKMVFSADDTKFAIGTGNIQVYDVNNRQLLNALYLERDFYIRDLTFSPDGSLLGAVTNHGDVYVWNLSNNEIVFELAGQERLTYLETHAYGMQSTLINNMVYEQQSLAFSPNSKLIALQNGPNIEIWDINIRKLQRTLDEIDLLSVPTKFSFTGSGNEIIAIVNLDETLAVWNTESGKLIRQTQIPEVAMKSNNISAFQNGIFARIIYKKAENENYMEIWNIEKNQVYTYEDLPIETDAIQISKNGQKIAISGYHTEFYILDVQSMQLELTPNIYDYYLDEYAINSTGTLLLRENYMDFLDYDSKTGPLIWNIKSTHESAPLHTATPFYSSPFHYDPTATPFPYEEVALDSSNNINNNQITDENISELELVAEIGKGKIINAKWSEDMNHLHVFSSSGYYLLDAQTLELISQYEPDGLVVTDGTISDSKHIILCGTTSSDQIEVWDMSNNERLAEFQSKQEPAISPDGNLLVYIKADLGLVIWNIRQNKYEAYFESGSIVPKPVFSSDQKYIAVSGLVYDLNSGTIINDLNDTYSNGLSVHFSPDNNYIIGTTNESAHAWPIDPNQSGIQIPLFNKIVYADAIYSRDTVESIAMNQDASIIAVGTSKRDLLLYNANNANLVGKISTSDGIPDQLFYSPDGLQILAADKNGRLILWNAVTGYRITTSYLFSNTISDLTAQPDGNIISITQNMATTFSSIDGEEIKHIVIPANEIFAASPAGNYLAGYTPIQVSIYNANDGSLIITLPEKAKETDLMCFETWRYHPEQKFYGADFSLDGTRLVTFAEGGWWIYDQGMLLTDIQNETVRQIFTPISKISQDGTLVIGTPEGYLRGFPMLKAKTGEYYGGLELGYYGLLNDAIEISADKKWIGFLQSYNNCSNNYGCAFDFVLADPLNGSEINFSKLNIYSDSEQTTFTFNQSTTLAAVAHSYGVISIISIPDMEILYSFKAHSNDIVSLTFSMDNSRLISADENGIIRIWAVP